MALIVAVALSVAMGATASADEDVDVEFEVANVSPAIESGGSASVTIDVVHNGTETAYDVESTVSAGGGVVIDGGSATDVLGDIEAGETVTVTVTARAGSSVSPGEKPLTVALTWEDDEGETNATTVTDATISVHTSSFTILELEDTLSVGYDGHVRGTIRNDGDRTVEDPLVVIAPSTSTLVVEDVGYALPDLEPGETAGFSYPIDVLSHADPGSRQLQFYVEHTAPDGSSLQSGPLTERVVVDPRTNAFSIRTVPTDTTIDLSAPDENGPTNDGSQSTADDGNESEPTGDGNESEPTGDGNETKASDDDTGSSEGAADDSADELDPASGSLVATIPAGESAPLVIEITNQRPETLTEIDAQLYATDHLRPVEGSAYVHELAPGESAELRFEVAASSDATVNATHPVELDFEYRTERGTTTLSTLYKHPMYVIDDAHPAYAAFEMDDSNLLWWGAAAFVTVLTFAAVGAGVYFRRR